MADLEFTDELAAETLLKLAREHLHKDETERAVGLMRAIIELYRGTAGAATARELLRQRGLS